MFTGFVGSLKGLGEKTCGITPMSEGDGRKKRSTSLSETTSAGEWTGGENKPSMVVMKKPDLRIMKKEESTDDKRPKFSHPVA